MAASIAQTVSAPAAVAAHAVSRPVRVVYGVGSIAYGAAAQGLTSMLLLFYSQVVGLPAPAVGVALMVALVLDAIFDPLLGQWSDNVRSRWGRRHPFMYASAVPLALAFYALWNPPRDWSGGALFAYLLTMLIAVRLLTSLYEIPSSALAPELAPDYDRRTGLLSYRYFFTLVGTTAMSVLAYQVFLRKDAGHPLGLFNRAGYGHYGLAAGLVIAASILISTLGTHGQIPRLSQPARRAFSFTAMLRQFAAVLSNRSFVSLMTAGMIYGVVTGVQQGLRIYIYSFFWGLPPNQLAYLAWMGLLASIFGVSVAPALARRMGKKRAMIAIFCLALFSSVIPLCLRLVGLMPANHTPALLAVLLLDALVTDTLGIIGFIIFASMVGDIAEDNAVKTGERSEGLLFAANGLLRKCVSGLGIFLSSLLLAVVGFPRHADVGQVDPAVLHRLILVYLPVTAGLSVFSIVSLTLYRIDRAAHQRNLERLRAAAALGDQVAGEAYAGVEPIA